MEESIPTVDVPALLQEGASLFIANDYTAAADRYAQALETLVRLHGELAPETADCYYFYGNSLLQKLSKDTENNLFGEVVMQAAEEKLAPAMDEEAGEEAEDAGEQGGDSEEAGEVSERRADEPTEEVEVDAGEPEASQEDPSSVANEVASSVDSESDENELEDIWNNLESARIIYERTLNYAGLLNVHSALGELEIYREKYGAAIEELQRALSILDANSHPRRAAELHYQLGLACLSTFGKEEAAIEHFEKSIEILEALKNEKPELAEELEGVLKDIHIKLEDAKEQGQSLQRVRAESQSLSQQFDTPADTSAPVVDLGVFGKHKLALSEAMLNEQKELNTKQVKGEPASSQKLEHKENETTN